MNKILEKFENDQYEQAKQFVIDNQVAFISTVQRKFRIGYNRAARLMDRMETDGVISSFNNQGFREVLVKPH